MSKSQKLSLIIILPLVVNGNYVSGRKRCLQSYYKLRGVSRFKTSPLENRLWKTREIGKWLQLEM